MKRSNHFVLIAASMWLGACTVYTQQQPTDPSSSPSPARPRPDSTSSLRPAGPVDCRGTETIRLERVIIETGGPAVTARNRCNVEIVDSRIVSGEWAIRMNGETTITLVRTTVQGSQGAVKMNDSAVLSARGSSFAGGLERKGQAVYRDQGGNRWQGGAP